MTAEQWWRKAVAGDVRGIARCITLIEAEDPGMAACLRTLPAGRTARIIGVTGPPGAGKSTLVDALVDRMTAVGRRVAVLCVDPSSPFSHGAILGDRVRMGRWYDHPAVYIRSLASRGALGGLHPATLEIAQFLGGCPFDDILVETVGVGQSEVEVAALADVTVVVLVPESGDEIQALKAGLMEVGDVFVVNKADRPEADRFIGSLHAMMTLGRRAEAGTPPVLRTVASRGEGVAELLEAVDRQAAGAAATARHLDRMADRAWHLIRKNRMKDVRKAELRDRISTLVAEGRFNLYAFTENYRTMDSIPNEGFPRAAACEPACVKVEAGKTYAWCTCGLSEKQPFCDGAHKRIEGMPYKSLKVTFEKDEEVWLCQCKQTKNPPFCDGSHRQIS